MQVFHGTQFICRERFRIFLFPPQAEPHFDKIYTAIDNFVIAWHRGGDALCKPHPENFMARPPAIQWYYKQWLGDNKVLAMDWDARGMHFHLLMISIQEEPSGSLPNDMDAIRRWLSLPSGSVDADRIWRRVKPQIFAAWSLQDDRWFNSGMVETMERQQRYKERYDVSTKTVSNTKKKKSKINEFQSSLFQENPSADGLEVLVEEIGHLHPANAHMKSVALPLPQQEAISDAINRDGAEAVHSGTKNLADKVSQWPAGDLRYVPNPIKFYREGEYLRNPAMWERKLENGREECSLHPDSRRTQSGLCWDCNTSRYVSGCQPA